MALKVQIKTIDYVTKLVSGSTNQMKVAQYFPQKIPYDERIQKKLSLPEVRPEEKGVSSRYIAQFLEEITKDRKIDPHAIMILRHGNIITDENFRPEEQIDREERGYQQLQKLLRHLRYHEPYQESIITTAEHLKRSRIKEKSCQQNIWKKRKQRKEIEFKALNKKKYQMEPSSTGILPLFLQCLHNNYAKGIEEIEFQIEKEEMYMKLIEGEKEFLLPVGMERGNYKETSLEFNEEVYQVATRGIWTS